MKRGILLALLVMGVVTLLLIGGCAEEEEEEEEVCAVEGEQFSEVYEEYLEHCCEGLTEWNSGFDTSISIEDECYDTMLMAGSPIGTCINCGNGVCEDIENPCNCLEDCEGQDKSDFATVKKFCQSVDWEVKYLVACREHTELPLCNLC